MPSMKVAMKKASAMEKPMKKPSAMEKPMKKPSAKDGGVPPPLVGPLMALQLCPPRLSKLGVVPQTVPAGQLPGVWIGLAFQLPGPWYHLEVCPRAGPGGCSQGDAGHP